VGSLNATRLILIPETRKINLVSYLLVRSKQVCQGQALTGVTIEYSIKLNFASSHVHKRISLQTIIIQVYAVQKMFKDAQTGKMFWLGW
jgi:hypothetical protein